MKTIEKIKALNLEDSLLPQRIAKAVGEAILDGSIKEGERLIETDLQKMFKLSRTPIREAFRELEKRGLVEIIPRKGTIVKKVTREDIEENFPVRSCLEGLAAREAFYKMTADDIRELRRALTEMRKAVKKKNFKAFWQHHLEFHEVFINACDNSLIINILKTLRTHSMWHRFSYEYYKGDLRHVLAVHEEIMRLFESKDSEPHEVEQKVREHIDRAYDTFLAFLDSHESQGTED
jgi:DNA-binding GntR family transcriptional regulator